MDEKDPKQWLDEFESINSGPRSVFELTILSQLPGIVDDLLNATFDSEEDLLCEIEARGYRAGGGVPVDIPAELQAILENFSLKRHPIIDGDGKQVAAVGVLAGGQEKLQELNSIIEEWRRG